MKIMRKIFIFILALTISLGVVADVTLAQERDANFWSNNDIVYYDPTYQSTCSAGSGMLRGANTKEKIWNFFIGNDLTPEQAAGLMGNIQKESNFIPVNWQAGESTDIWDGDSGEGWGLVQWDGGRRPQVLETIRKEKPHLEKYTEYKYQAIAEPNADFPQADFDEMLLFLLDYMMQESMDRPTSADHFPGSADYEWPRMKEQPTLRDATLFWERNFEVSGDINYPERLELRVTYAEDIFAEFKDNLSAEGSGTAGCQGANGLQELTLAYAWPEYINPGSDPDRAASPKPAYAEATRESGRYVGGCTRGNCGIDCGAFVTFLITNSGWDPGYNHNGKIADGAGPTGTQQDWAIQNWEPVFPPGDPIDAGQLQSGDVAFRPGHTFVFVGDIPDFGPPPATKGIASASIGPTSWRAPMAGRESAIDSDLTWYRKKQ